MIDGDPVNYDDDFDNEEDAILVRNAVVALADKINAVTPNPQNILDVLKSDAGDVVLIQICERDTQILRFALGRALETF